MEPAPVEKTATEQRTQLHSIAAKRICHLANKHVRDHQKEVEPKTSLAELRAPQRDFLVRTLAIMIPPLTLLALAQVIAIAAGPVVATLGLGCSPVAVAIGSTLLLAASTTLA